MIEAIFMKLHTAHAMYHSSRANPIVSSSQQAYQAEK
jgi:hypothetical protein